MTDILVDTSVLLDVLTNDPAWATWSAEAIASADGRLCINQIVVAELAPGFRSLADLNGRLPAEIEKNYLSMRRSWLVERLQPTAGAVDLAHRQLPISTLAPTPPWPATACSPATQQWYALTFPIYR
jgi:predicted nucleic acid-binding protein